MKYLCIWLSLILLFVVNVEAHPGGTDSNGCHHCRGETCDKYGMERNFYHTHVNGQSVPCPFPDPEVSYNDNYYYEYENDSDEANIEKDEFIRSPIKHESLSKPTETNEDIHDDSNDTQSIFDIIEEYLGIGLLLFFIFVAIVSSIKPKQNTNEIDLIKKDFYENKEKYLNKNNPYTKTKVKDVNDYIKYKLEYNKRHKND